MDSNLVIYKFSIIIVYEVNCEWSEWTLGHCSKSCGAGERLRTRSKTVVEAHDGSCNGSFNEIETWMQGHPEWPILSSPKMQNREKPTSPVTLDGKRYPFTVEVIAENDSLQKKLDFSPEMRRNKEDIEIHSNAAIVLNSTSVS